ALPPELARRPERGTVALGLEASREGILARPADLAGEIDIRDVVWRIERRDLATRGRAERLASFRRPAADAHLPLGAGHRAGILGLVAHRPGMIPRTSAADAQGHQLCG